MLATLIQRYDKIPFHFKSERLAEILQAVRCHILWLYYIIYQFIKPFLDNKMSIFEEYGAFKHVSKAHFKLYIRAQLFKANDIVS